MRALQLISEMPVFAKTAGGVSSPEGPLRSMDIDQVGENIVIFFEPNGNFFKPKGWIMAYFVDSPESAQMLRAGKVHMPMFHQGSAQMRFTGYSMIDAIWNKPKSFRSDSPAIAAAKKETPRVVGACEAYMLTADGEQANEETEGPKKIYIDNISVRPGWKKQSVGRKLIQAIVKNWPGIPLDHSGTTDAGYKFMHKTGYLRHHQDAGGDERPSNKQLKSPNQLLPAPPTA